MVEFFTIERLQPRHAHRLHRDGAAGRRPHRVRRTGVACHTGSRTCFDDGLIGSPDFALTGDVGPRRCWTEAMWTEAMWTEADVD